MKKVFIIVAFMAISLPGFAQEKSLKIGVLRITEAFKAYKKTKALEESLNDRLAAQNTQAKSIKDKLIEIESKIKKGQASMMNESKLNDLKEEMKIEQLRFKLFRSRTLAKAEAEQIKSISKVYADIRKTVNAYAKEKGFDLILQLQSGDGKHESYKELEQEINLTIVLHHSDKLDVTADIIKRLNDSYKPE